MLTVVHGVISAAAPALSIGLLAAALIAQNFEAVRWSLWGLVLFQFAWVLLLLPIEMALRHVVSNRGEANRWLSGRALAMMPLAILTTQLVYPFALIKAMFTRKVEWRGIHYSIDGPWQIRLDAYSPFSHVQQSSEHNSL
jgi:hypothetical protein